MSGSVERPNKRPRQNENGTGSANYERGDLWYDDGNVILVAEGSAFRVYRGLLCRSSEVFRDMFTFPQPADVETWEGCPVVHLSDSKKALSRVLRVIYEHDDTLGYNQCLPFETVAAMLQLGSKYQMDHLRQDAISRLSFYFPTRYSNFHNILTDLDEDDVEADVLIAGCYSPFPTGPIAPSYLQMATCTINLARAHDLPNLLPSAFYMVSQMHTDDVFDGYEDTDGTHWKLSLEDIRCCIKGQEFLRHKVIESRRGVVPRDDCLHPDLCLDELRTLQGALLDSANTDASALVPYSFGCGFCAKCHEHLSAYCTTSREATWNELVQYFSLEDVIPVWPVAHG